MENPSGVQLIIQLLNGITALIMIYCIISIPVQIIRRIVRKRKDLPVSPLTLIFKKLLKYWVTSAACLIPISSVLILISGNELGLSGQQLFPLIVTQAIIGNVGTSLLVAYVFLRIRKTAWTTKI